MSLPTPPYDPLTDLRTRYPDWHLDVGEIHGPVALVNPLARRVVVDSGHLAGDQDFTLAYLVSLLDMDCRWPVSACTRKLAGKEARSRLGR